MRTSTIGATPGRSRSLIGAGPEHRHIPRHQKTGEAGSLREIADKEGVDNSYVSRMINRTCLAPDIVAAILDDTLPDHVTLFDLEVDPPRLWEEQRNLLCL